ncbi:hypothetical protein LSAT2_013675 [Lamellibrachia satsuma]|nr:hypothetical protein LSAT2_013675 [Lamellibrachia satsuma]
MFPVRHVLDLDSMLFGVSHQKPRSLAFQLAVKNDITHGFNNEKLMISTGTTTTSTVRACGFNVKSCERPSTIRGIETARPPNVNVCPESRATNPPTSTSVMTHKLHTCPTSTSVLTVELQTRPSSTSVRTHKLQTCPTSTSVGRNVSNVSSVLMGREPSCDP